MRVFIITMDDPVHTKKFIKQIIDVRRNDIVGLAMTKGDRLTLGRDKSKFAYILSLLLIMGTWYFLENVLISVSHKIKKIGNKYNLCNDPTISGYAQKLGIPVFKIKSPNDESFLEQIIALRPDIIINQSQSIIKKELLSIPSIGIINRHNALLPKNRGRLTPFWVLNKAEKETGVTIHFIDERLDAGKIVVQVKYQVTKKDTFNSLVKKNYEIAPKAMLEALSIIENGYNNFLSNDDNKSSYNSTPTFKEAFLYRIKRLFR